MAGALPGDSVGFLGARRPGSWCPAVLGGSCADLDQPQRLGSAIADATGAASLDVAVPAGITPEHQAWFQAVASRPSEPAEVAPAIEVVYAGP